ncbi:MAG TPA: HEPN domain-containing protein [Candidatus Dojkabacteria bacterium]|nr:HEPN domain-containing protein [Candidatus Dojkabacteria bacterium]HRP50996.1 HEPN domain-containing protein [Candidatus Dojkabacteria bacterium]
MIEYKHESKKARHIVWFRQGEFDLQASKLSLDEGFYEWSTFQAVQAVEKSLKAVIVYAGANPPRIHKLQTLMGICNRICPEFKQTKFQFRFLESFTFVSRYPFLLPGRTKTPHEIITKPEAERAYTQAQEFLKKISVILSHPMESQELLLSYDEMFTKEEIENRLKVIREKLIIAFDPEKIILFGRFARDKQVSRLSTMDILIIAKTDASFIERIFKARKSTKEGSPIIEPLVYTPEEFNLMVDDEGESFLETALQEGQVIYEKPKH